MTTKWHVLLIDGNVCGPFTEGQVQQGIRNGKITDAMRVRQGTSGWIRVAKVRKLFQGLSTDGFYLRDSTGQVFGPFTESRLQAMQANNQLPEMYWIRQGLNDTWKLVGRQKSHVNSQPNCRELTAGPTHLPAKNRLAEMDKTIPQRPNVPPAPVMKLRGGSWVNVVAGARTHFDWLFRGDAIANG